MAPWCPACRSFQSSWQSLADWSRDLDISVGVVDVTENPGLQIVSQFYQGSNFMIGTCLCKSCKTIQIVGLSTQNLWDSNETNKRTDKLSFVNIWSYVLSRFHSSIHCPSICLVWQKLLCLTLCSNFSTRFFHTCHAYRQQ